MHYRARVIGATLSLHPAGAGGTEVKCVFMPVSSEGLQHADGLDNLNGAAKLADEPKISV